jgi:hypothetical protein
MTKIVINWWCDSTENWSIHRNGPGMSADQSFLGRITRGEHGWTIMYLKDGIQIDLPQMFTSLYEAKKKLMEAVDGEPLDIWA